MIPLFAELPDFAWVMAALVVFGILAFIGIAFAIRFLRSALADIAAVLKREIAAAGEPQLVEVQSPLEVTKHAGVATKQMVDETHGRISRERDAIKAEVARVEAASEKRADKLEEKLDANTLLTSAMSGEVKAMNQNIQNLTQSLTNFLQNQAR